MGPGVAPLALLWKPSTPEQEFKEHLIDQYKFEVLGGAHTIAARKELLVEAPRQLAYNTC